MQLLNHLVAGLTAMRVRYDRSSEVDALLRHHCIHTTVPTSPSNVPQETLLLATSLRFDDDNLTDAEIRIKAAEKHLKLQHHPNPAIAAAAMTTFNASTMDPAVARKYTNAWRRISGTINEPIEYYYSDDAPSDTPFGKVSANERARRSGRIACLEALFVKRDDARDSAFWACPLFTHV